MNHTTNYQLSQWEAGDKVQRTDFNADNTKIDGALAEKADVSALDALSQTVAGHTAALAGKGNCRIYFSSYTGTGTYGSGNPTTRTFSGKPLLVMAGGGDRMLLLFQGVGKSFCCRGAELGPVDVSWSGNSVSWSAPAATTQLNESNRLYNIMALIAVS